MKPVIKLYRFDRCPKCKQNKSIEAYDFNNKPLNFSHMIDINALHSLKDKSICYMKCKLCKEEFIIEWLSDYTPRPLYRKSSLLSILKHFTNENE